MKARIAMIVAMTPDRIIGRKGKLPWKLPADMRHFKQTTMGCPVIMGRNTYESIGKPLRGRKTIVLTTKKDYEVIGGQVARNANQALQLARRGIIESVAASFESAAAEVPEPLIMIIGGESVYRAFLPVAERIYLTLVHAAIEGDTHFPHFDRAAWVETSRTDHAADEENPLDYSFIVLDRKVALQGSGGSEAAPGQRRRAR